MRQRRKAESIASAVTKSFDTVKEFDLYPKLKDDHKKTDKTTTGAVVTIVSGVVMFVLFCSELSNFLATRTLEAMKVDPTLGERLVINFDITFHALHCAAVNMDAMDVAGEQQNGLLTDVTKTRLAAGTGEVVGVGVRTQLQAKAHGAGEDHEHGEGQGHGQAPMDPCNCYGAENEEIKCCNTCELLTRAYELKGWSTLSLGSTPQCANTAMGEPGEGCNIAGHMSVNKVAGNFHIAMGQTHSRESRHIHQFNPAEIPNYNVSHRINKLYFGELIPGQVNPLDGRLAVPAEVPGTGVYQYFIKIVPTRLLSGTFFSSTVIHAAQYSVTSSFRPALINGQRQNVLPGVFWVYDLSPFMVDASTYHTPLFEFLTALCAIIGGVITVAGMVNSFLHYLPSKKAPAF